MKAARVVVLIVAVMLIAAVWLLLPGGFVESRTPIGIDISRASGAPQFSFSRCSRRPGELRLYLLEVVEPRPGTVREECEVTRQASSVTHLPQSWRYGESIPDFKIEGCDPLRPGKYRVLVMGEGQFGSREFQLVSDGTVSTTQPACR